MWKFPSAARGPKVSKGRPESPLVAFAEAKSPVRRKKQGSIFSLPSISNLFLVGGFVRLRADEVLSPRGKVPKGRRRLRIRQRRIRRSQSDLAFAKRKPTLGGQRVHAAWPPPVPPLLSYSAPLASQGRAQLGSRPSLGGPLSPSAQLIPPPAFGRRFIPEVVARSCCGRKILRRHVPRLRCQAKCGSAAVSDW